ncbi:class I SAM-dependent methyltransferase [Roseicyclus sp.]
MTDSYQSFLSSPHVAYKHTTYFDSYDHFLGQYRGNDITFVEIGVLDGGSLFMWRDFFGSKARIIGVDLNPAAKKWEEEGFEIFIGSQSDPDFWARFVDEVGPVDVVLDDGGHTYAQQIVTVEVLLPHVNDGGLVLVEDTHTSYMSGFGTPSQSFMEYVKQRVDAVNFRFGGFPKEKSETRFWSIEVVESMVGFRIRKGATARKSEPIFNIGSRFESKDYRLEDAGALKPVEEYFNFNAGHSKLTLRELILILQEIRKRDPGLARRMFEALK